MEPRCRRMPKRNRADCLKGFPCGNPRRLRVQGVRVFRREPLVRVGLVVCVFFLICGDP